MAHCPGRRGRPFPSRGQIDGGLVLVGLAAVVGFDLVGVALLPACLALGELLVELAGVEEDERGELDRPRCRVDRAAVAGLDQERDQAAMVEMGMGQEHGVDVACIECERDPVADRFVRAALEHPAVDEDPGPFGDEQELRAGDGGRATEEVDLHARHGDSARPRSWRAGRVSSVAMGIEAVERSFGELLAVLWRRRRGADTRRTGRSRGRVDACAGETLPGTPACVRPRARRARGSAVAATGDDARAIANMRATLPWLDELEPTPGARPTVGGSTDEDPARGPGEGFSLPALR